MTRKYYSCPACNGENAYRSFTTDRAELEREVGESIPVTCAHCHARKTLHPNDIKAKPNPLIPILASIPAAVLLIWLLLEGWILLSAVLFSVPVLARAAQRKSAEAFNGYRIR